MKKKLLVFHPALAPYRIDFFNSIVNKFDALFYFSNDNLKDQTFNQDRLRSKCNFKFNLLLNGFEVGKRSFRTGIFKIINEYKPEIIICSEYSQITLQALIYKYVLGKKFKVYTISDDSLDLSFKRSGIRKWLRDFLSNYIDGIIFPSDSVSNWYHANVNSSTKLITIPIIHDNDIFRNKISELLPNANNNLLKYKLQNKKIFLFVGRLVAVKNVAFLINAYANVVSSMADSKLVIIGDGEEYFNLQSQVSKLGINENCIFTGRFEGDELSTWFLVADCLVLPSYYEPYGVVVNEALLSGCKVLCSNLAGASDLVTNSNGALFNPYNLNDLSNLLIDTYNEISIKNSITYLRTDLMPFHFNEKFSDFISSINNN